jgi:succinate dehydrogenase/fumarate reductase cytochrome b subunit
VTFAFFLHFCGGIRHLVWDTVHGFELRSIYISGWAVVAAERRWKVREQPSWWSKR